MRFMLLIKYGTGPAAGPGATEAAKAAWDQLPAEEQKEIAAQYGALNQTPGVTPGTPLVASTKATTVRVVDGETVTADGPFMEVQDALAGFYFADVDSLDAAIELAARVPHARLGGAVEVRPVVGG